MTDEYKRVSRLKQSGNRPTVQDIAEAFQENIKNETIKKNEVEYSRENEKAPDINNIMDDEISQETKQPESISKDSQNNQQENNAEIKTRPRRASLEKQPRQYFNKKQIDNTSSYSKEKDPKPLSLEELMANEELPRFKVSGLQKTDKLPSSPDSTPNNRGNNKVQGKGSIG